MVQVVGVVVAVVVAWMARPIVESMAFLARLVQAVVVVVVVADDAVVRMQRRVVADNTMMLPCSL